MDNNIVEMINNKENKKILFTIDFSKKEKYLYRFLCSLFFVIPFIIFLGLLTFTDVKITNLTPLSIDAQEWFLQTKSIVKYGCPLGFNGYNETHAKVGTFGPWGATIAYFVSLGSRLFGCHSWSPMLINVLKWILANVIFFLFTHPNKKQLIRLILVQCVLYVNILYLFNAMSEVTRYSMAIILAGLMYYLLYNEQKNILIYKIVLYVIAPIILCLFTMAHVLFSFCIPIYMYVMFRYLKFDCDQCRWRRLLMGMLFFVVLPFFFIVILFYLNTITAAHFPSNSPLREFMKTGDFSKFLITTLQYGFNNLKYLKYSFIIKDNIGSVYSSYKFMYNTLCLLVIINIVILIKNKANRKSIELVIIVAYSLLIFMLGFCFLYDISGSTYKRGVNVGLNFALYMYCLYDNFTDSSLQTDLRRNNGFRYVIVVMLITLIPFLSFILGTLNGFKKNTWCNIFNEKSKIYSKYIKPVKSSNAWDNTVAYYYLEGKTNIQQEASIIMLAALPAGIGYNEINRYPYRISKSKYVVTTKNTEPKIKSGEITLSNYHVIYNGNDIWIYERNN